MPKGVSHLPDPPLTPPGLCYTLEEWREAAQQLDLRAVEQAEEERRKEDQQKAAAKAKPYQVQPEQTASRDSDVLRHLQSECVNNVPNMCFRINFCLTSNMLVFTMFDPTSIQYTHGHRQPERCCLRPGPAQPFGGQPPRGKGQ